MLKQNTMTNRYQDLKNKVERKLKHIRKMHITAGKYCERCSGIAVARENVLVSYGNGSYESGGSYDWPEYTEYDTLNIALKKDREEQKVLVSNFGEEPKVSVYIPGDWEKVFYDIFSSRKSVEIAKEEFRRNAERKAKLEEIAKKREAEKKRITGLAKVLLGDK